MDETYQAYLNRVAKLTLPETYRNQVQHIQESPKFNHGQPVPFPGYTINTPGNQDQRNQAFYDNLIATQQEILAQLVPGLLLPVPAESFHLTVADLIWDANYQHALATHGEAFEGNLCDRLAHSFSEYQKSVPDRGPIELQLVGLLVRPRAIAVALVPIDDNSYHKMLQLRRAVYQNSGLIALGIDQQYPFTAHIPLGYFAQITEDLDRDRLCDTLMAFNDRWIGNTPEILRSHSAALYQFDDMTHFYQQDHFPAIDF
ncbi:DUF1868 domain-containing protein [Spirulina major CS-329]|uniref:DUF1868 domain-containing protein n=1 Tax=Spirulina TaxID=1154 RepID=UPI00232E606C|nr:MULTISPECIES: DUF1868 domain-containing protein [Spirulina]MDB9494124.1 DUF1868 domain-containing protein [Spirulina subsalsa CS-330]MDB9501448.1 DUF1868 domain-containing protein [Spirulina major CS-329]